MSQRPSKELFQIFPAGHPGGTEAVLVATLRVTTRGRITVPKSIREELGLKAGDRIEYVPQDDGSYIVQRAD